MRKFWTSMLVVLFLGGSLFAGVVKRTKSEVTFKGFGTFSLILSDKTAGEKRATDSKSEFKGKGLVGRISGKFLLQSGNFGEIIDIPGLTVYSLDHKKKEFESRPIEKLGEQEGQKEIEEAGGKEEEYEESDIRITRSEFRVEKTGEEKVINRFPCTKYAVSWITEWENIKTEEKGTTRLLTDVWATPLTDSLKAAQNEDVVFLRAYMKAIGLDQDRIQQDILGASWLQVFRSLSVKDSGPRQDASSFGEEMRKIEGYPVVIDGKFYSTREGSPAEAGETEDLEEKPAKSLKGVLGKLAKKALSKKEGEQKADEPSFSYYTELLELSAADLTAGEFEIPPGYRKKE